MFTEVFYRTGPVKYRYGLFICINHHVTAVLGDDHLILKGGGAGTFGRDILFIFIMGLARKFISG